MDVALHHYQQALRSVQSAIETGTLRRLANNRASTVHVLLNMRHFDALVNKNRMYFGPIHLALKRLNSWPGKPS